ncbi:MAG: amidase, partial [Vicinamibacterales bacterium]
MPLDPELLFKPAHELAGLIKARQISPVELTEAFLARAEALNPRVNAFITVTTEPAMAAARAAEREIMAGDYRGPLHGIPYAPKDILATRGIRTTNGSKVTADWVPDYESTITERLNAAGAILAGKLNLLEFAMGSGVVSGFGPAHNPWDLTRTPSGSSSGSGAALAAAMIPLSIGTDTGGSIRGPAAFCGIVGLKQTYGRVSRHGVTTLAWTLDHAGPMTRSVADAALMLQVIAGPDPRDRTTVDVPVPDYTLALNGDVKGLRIGVPTRHFTEGADPEVEAAYRAALQQLVHLGATLVDVDVPHANYAGSAGWLVAMAEAAQFHEKRLRETPELFDPVVRERLDAARFYTATDYIKALRVRTILMDEMAAALEACDVMAVPGSTSLPGPLEPPEVAGTDVKPGSA